MAETVIQHVLTRLAAIGVEDIFGVPGDFSFPINDAMCTHPKMRWIGCCNELNAAYAADGYARIRGIGALCTTYGVGELSALAGVAGAYAEHLPIFHLVGTPGTSVQNARALMHHTLGNGEFDLFRRMSEPVVCAYAVMTPQNVAYETERLIFEALYHRRPVYMAFPADLADQPVVSTANPLPPPTSDPASLDAACAAILAALDEAKSACILAGGLLSRLGASESLRALVDASGLPLTTMFMDKSVLDERHPFYLGMYNGALMNETVRDFVENCDIILSLGAPMTDLSSGAFTARLDPDRTIVVNHHSVQVKGKTYISVEIDELVQKLVKRCGKQRDWKRLSAASLGPIIGAGNTAISAEALYPRWECFLKENDMLFAESGTVSMGLGFALMPKGANFYNQTLWASIGWATPASFGAAVAAPQRRVVLITGEGAHQMTAQEISQFARFGLKPVIFVLNNNGYLIERLLCRTPDIAYNDIAQWRYAELPRALGCEGWFCARVATCEEFDTALKKAEDFPSGVYIEIVTDTYAASPMALKLHDSMKSLYKS